MAGLNQAYTLMQNASGIGYNDQQRGDRNSLGVRYDSDDYAVRTHARITRKEWQDYQDRYFPIENDLISMYDSPELRMRETQRASDQVTKAFDKVPEQQDRFLRGLNVTLTPEQQKARERSHGLSKSLADVSARNTTLNDLEDRDYQIATGLAQGRQAL